MKCKAAAIPETHTSQWQPLTNYNKQNQWSNCQHNPNALEHRGLNIDMSVSYQHIHRLGHSSHIHISTFTAATITLGSHANKLSLHRNISWLLAPTAQPTALMIQTTQIERMHDAFQTSTQCSCIIQGRLLTTHSSTFHRTPPVSPFQVPLPKPHFQAPLPPYLHIGAPRLPDATCSCILYLLFLLPCASKLSFLGNWPRGPLPSSSVLWAYIYTPWTIFCYMWRTGEGYNQKENQASQCCSLNVGHGRHTRGHTPDTLNRNQQDLAAQNVQRMAARDKLAKLTLRTHGDQKH